MSAIICWAVIAAFVVVVVYGQAATARRNAVTETTSLHPNIAVEITGRLAVAQSQVLSNDSSVATKKTGAALRQQILANIKQLAVSPVDHLAEVVIIRELEGRDRALENLTSMRPGIMNSVAPSAGAQTLGDIYTRGPTAVSPESRNLLVDHLRWFGKLAVTQGAPDIDAGRAAILSSAHRSLLIVGGIATGLLLMLGLGILLLIWMIVLFALGKARFAFSPGPASGPPVFLESFALWAVAFMGLSLGLHRWKSSQSPIVFETLFAVVSIAVSFWPMCRGLSWSEVRQSLGWHAGRGVFTEIGAGVVGYIAGLPIIGLGVLFTLILIKISHASPTHPIAQELIGDMPLPKMLAMLFTISIAAPFLEETMFRGALYFHLRRRWRPWISATIVAFIFAAIHPQGWAAIPVLGSIAIVLALLREWRGSLLASMTAHDINNGIVFLTIVTVLR